MELLYIEIGKLSEKVHCNWQFKKVFLINLHLIDLCNDDIYISINLEEKYIHSMIIWCDHFKLKSSFNL